MAIICGFNEFCQLNHFNTSLNINEGYVNSDTFGNISGLRFSWSYCINSSGDDVYVSGFVGKQNNCKKLVVPGQDKISQLSCSRRHCLVLTVSGQCWKYTLLNEQWTNLNPVLFAENPINACITHISCGETQNIAVTSNGWIYNIPSRISFLPEIVVKDIACGKEHTVLLTSAGHVFTCGAGSRGQLGNGDLEPEEQLREVQVLSNLNVKCIAVGGWHTWVLTEDHKLFSWGWNSNGQLACPLSECKVQTEPRIVMWPTEAGVQVNKIACGSRHTVFLLSNGLVYGCGWNNYGQLLLPNTTTDVDEITILPVPDGIKCQDIVCGAWNTGFLKKNIVQ